MSDTRPGMASLWCHLWGTREEPQPCHIGRYLGTWWIDQRHYREVCKAKALERRGPDLPPYVRDDEVVL